MKISPRLLLLLLAVTLPAPMVAQVPDTLAAEPAEPPPPAGLAAAEISRSLRCVPTLARLDTLNVKLEPLAVRSTRMRQLLDAVTREDTTRAAPFDARDPVDASVSRWFAADQTLAVQYSTTGDSLVEARRARGREEIGKRLQSVIDSTNVRAKELMDATGELDGEVAECENVLLVRSAVLERCPPSLTIPVCAAARTDSVVATYHFVGDPVEMWDVESSSLWTDPVRLGVSPNGSILGAESSVSERRGNLVLGLAIRPMVQERANLTPEELATLEAGLDSIGVTYKHPRFVIAPTLSFEFIIAEPIAGENFYFLHFGDLSQPTRDVIWSGPAPARGPTRMIIPGRKSVLDRLAAGEIVSLTAVRFADATSKQAEAVYSLELPSLRQDSAVGGLMQYYTGGQLGQDFDAIVPPTGG